MNEGKSVAGPTMPSVSADQLIAALQQKIGQYEVEATAATLLLRQQQERIHELEQQLQSPPAPTDS